ncbi:unnamed protein product [Lactuca saligna]|uniref:RHOMBOID-like protein n=1 Tax=Lactuca saligna TaxID=75948 RepID=A0AA35ZYF0_LACSI|nr:unnamed protein product [Lactuca saligna]
MDVHSSAKNSPAEIEIKVHSIPPPVRYPPLYTQPPPLIHHHIPPPPLYYHFSEEWFPWLVPFIFIVNVALFVLSMYINNCPLHSRSCIGVQMLQRFAFENVQENPLLGPSSATLLKMGALDANKVIQEGQQWRIVTSMWLHAGVLHIFTNMLNLLAVGIRLEQEFGFACCHLCFSAKTFPLVHLEHYSVYLEQCFSELLTNWTIYANKLATSTMLILMILIGLMVGILPHVDNFAHIGGFITGFFLGFILLVHPHSNRINQTIAPHGYYTKSKYKSCQHIFLVLSVIALSVLFTMGFVFLFRKVNGNDYCSWCHYLSCVPTPLWSCDPLCNSIQLGNQLNLTCLDNGKSRSYTLPAGYGVISVQELCSKLCI